MTGGYRIGPVPRLLRKGKKVEQEAGQLLFRTKSKWLQYVDIFAPSGSKVF
jgi:hypothetical protein